MDFKELLEKYQELLIENNRLRKELKTLNTQIGVEKAENINDNTLVIKTEEKIFERPLSSNLFNSSLTTNKKSDTTEKIKLFISLFRGRDDVFARRRENNKKDKSGYSPACANEWRSGICQKPKITCSACKEKNYFNLNDEVIDDHLRGRNNLVVGIFPMLINETCYFLAIDFDEEGWQKDLKTLREICITYDIPISVERSRSGNGAHAWFFFGQPISASLVRKFGSAMLTSAMSRQHDITFKSYDRLFPNQDTIKKVQVIVVTRPSEEYKEKQLNTWQEAIYEIKSSGVTLILKSNIHQKFALIDQKIVWYGSINLMSYGNSEESMMRIISPGIAFELKESTKKWKMLITAFHLPFSDRISASSNDKRTTFL